MFSLSRFTIFAALVASSVFAAPLNVRQDQNQGQPVGAGRPVNHSNDAASTFGTTTDAVNWQTKPTGLCITPAYGSDVGLGSGKTPLTVQQALDLCPRAARIAVHKD